MGRKNKEVAVKKRLTLGSKAKAEITVRFPAEDESSLYIVKKNNHHRKSRGPYDTDNDYYMSKNIYKGGE